ncbi:uncharacterized protein MYCFIDRAFT_152431 [Pseudocercospora fijiensis CIRAD86]|uniref:Maleylacetoacetate isomerase n=1 Tax=Pseudocercospora fijiensis (strain CIRAD86) TaxID=383855 RepID=M2Z2V7_PSEFD|nr:uncharacterized protein MYCFIDRAFT_152431 [Pseudocercospora fijiensis CIRAD86]EME84180.1 hypothetical protein MYCFIDRAFT_152431 [Pseudocercospora fijiensis CIRAD86]
MSELGLTLYTYFRSSCSCRVRTACHLKDIPLDYKFVNLVAGEQKAGPYIDQVNPSGLVPALVVRDASGKTVATITQSVAILEFLEEAFPTSRPLLPRASQPLLRARVRELVGIIACDIQPPTNLRIVKRLNGLGVTNQQWFQEMMESPLTAYESFLKGTAGKYSVGDEVTLADVCLAPAIENALRWEVDLSKVPNVVRVFDALKVLPEFVKGDWKHQDDTPENLRAP